MFTSPKSRIVVGAIALVCIIGAFALLAPGLISSERTRDALQAQFAKATGLPVRMSGRPDISLRPYFGVTYRNIEVGSVEAPMLVADEMLVRLSLLSALTGTPEASRIVLQRPRFALHAETLPQFLGANQSGLPEIVIENGVAAFATADGKQQRLGSLNGTVQWSGAASPIDVDLSGIWRDEVLTFTARLDNPSSYFSGETADISGTLRGSPGSLRFLGTVKGRGPNGEPLEAAGRFATTIASTASLGRWLDLADPLPNVAVSVAGDATIRGTAMLLADAAVTINEQTADGRLDVKLNPGGLLQIGGTLAFPALTLPALQTGEDGFGTNFSALARQSYVGLDLRVSADSMASAPLAIEGAAGGLIVADNAIQLDIAQATIGGADLTGTFAGTGSTLTADLTFGPGELDSLAPLLSDAAISPAGTGRARIDIFSEQADAGPPRSRITVSLEGGALQGFFFDALAELSDGAASESPFEGTTRLDQLETTVFVRDGTYIVREANLISQGGTVSLSGRGTVASKTLALRGTLTTADGDERPFFVGGTTSAPLAVSLPVAGAAPDRVTVPSGGTITQ